MAAKGNAKSSKPSKSTKKITSSQLTISALLLVTLTLIGGLSWYLFKSQQQEVREVTAQIEQPLTTQPSLISFRESAQRYHHQLYRLSDAEKAYRQWLTVSPNDPDAHLGLANLLATCARRHEAVPHYLRLISMGSVSDFLMLLAKEDGVVMDVQLLEKARKAAPQDPAPLLGLAWHAVEAGQQQRAEQLLAEAVRLDPEFIPTQIAKASVMVEAGRWDEFIRWNANASKDAERFPQTWILRAKVAENLQDARGAIRCYGEALQLSPETRLANAAVARLLSQQNEQLNGQLNELELAKRFSEYAVQLQQLGTLQDKLFFSAEPNGIESLMELIRRYEGVGRFWEAMAWTQVAYDVKPNHPDVRQMGLKLSEKLKGVSLQLTDVQATPARLLDLSKYPLPLFEMADSGTNNFVDMPERNSGLSTESFGTHSVPTFREDQQAAGLDFQYFNGAEFEPQHRMYEFPGGGIAVMDYDLDSFPDVYFTNGCRWPGQLAQTEFYDAFYRNVNGLKFEATSSAFPRANDGFGQGATVGDYDSDGFADLYVANIGGNRLYRNNGDGTFTDVSHQGGISGDKWTTSCVMVDLNGDTHPDIYDVNYVQGEDVFERICVAEDGKPAICMPFDLEASPDQILLNDLSGSFLTCPPTAAQVSTPGKGLGVVAFREPDMGLRLMVANDTTPNFLLVPSGRAINDFALNDQGILSGVAFNDAGKAEGSMGIAVGDIDANGLDDFVVTNFLNEANAVYLQQPSGGFVERSQATGLAKGSLDQLGFGTQLFDANLDGTLELFVANGHIDDLRRIGKEYQMRPQLFSFHKNNFMQFAPEDLGSYFAQQWLGRAVAKIDWNVDGRQDLLVGHLRSPSRLLTNVTESVGNFLAIQLVGTQSNRDAIGTIVNLQASRVSESPSSVQSSTHQLTAGDGYQASNQRLLIVGLGNSEKAETIDVIWPSGLRQSFDDVLANQQILIIEGQNEFKVVR